MKKQKPLSINMQNISFHEVYLLQCWWFFLTHFQNSVFGYSTMISNKGQRQICQIMTRGASVKCIKFSYIFYSPYHVIPDGKFTTCRVFARTAIWNHWEMREELVDLSVALDAGVTASFHAENWTKEHRTQSIICSSDGLLDVKKPFSQIIRSCKRILKWLNFLLSFIWTV